MAGNKEEFVKELKEFIENNKNNKITNSVVDRKLYDKIYERFVAGKRTNVKAITSVYKLCQYYLIACMISDKKLQFDIKDLVGSIVNYIGIAIFEDMFSEVEVETPDIKQPKNLRVIFENQKFYVSDGNNKYEAAVNDSSEVDYYLLPCAVNYNSNCWKDIEHKCSAAPGSIKVSVPWNIKATITFHKDTNKYLLEDIRFYADYNIKGLTLVARYSGLRRSAWVDEVSLDSYIESTTVENKEWEGSSIARGRAYICKNKQSITSIKSDWDGYYHTLTFDQLRELLEKAAI